MTHPYKTREGGATVTIFVPYDCRNHCPFCVNKQEYAHAEGFSVEAILKSIAVMDEITPRCDFVFTGGEPFANLKALQRMLDAIPTTHKVYINTTFPVQPGCSAEEMIAFTERNRDKITCINISRHLTKYVEESPDEVVARIATPKRVNCVLYMDYPADELVDYAERWRKYNIPVQFRYDYTETTPENLYQEEGDKILADLKKRFTYKGLDGCRMRNGYHFDYKGLVTFDRKTKKDSFYLYKAWWSEENFVHICSKRFTDRTEKEIEVKVYSNQHTVALYADGKKLAEQTGEHIFRFRVPLHGKVELKAVAGDCIDTASFCNVAEPNPSYKLVKTKSKSANWV